jgi:hypothetical protein
MPMTPDPSAASCRRRDAVIESLATSAATVPSEILTHDTPQDLSPRARGDASGVPAALTQHFECVTWPLATAVAGRRQDARDARIDIGAKMRGMWR